MERLLFCVTVFRERGFAASSLIKLDRRTDLRPGTIHSSRFFGCKSRLLRRTCQLVEQHPNLAEEQRNKILKNLQTTTLAQNRRVDITLSRTGQQSVRQFPFNAEDALTLINPKERAKPEPKKKPE